MADRAAYLIAREKLHTGSRDRRPVQLYADECEALLEELATPRKAYEVNASFAVMAHSQEEASDMVGDWFDKAEYLAGGYTVTASEANDGDT